MKDDCLGQGKHNSQPLATKLAVLRDQELGLGPDWRLSAAGDVAARAVRAHLKDPRVRAHRAYHAHLEAGTPMPWQILEAFTSLPREAQLAPSVGCVTGRLPVPQLAWRPGRTRPWRLSDSVAKGEGGTGMEGNTS